MTKTTNALSAIAAAALLAITLSACTQTATVTEPTSKPSASAAPVETPAAEPVVLEGDLDGNGRVSEFEKQVMAQNATRDYTLADGTVVAVDPKAPLPAPVAEAVKANAAGPVAGAMTGNPDARIANYATIRASLDADAAATGRGIIIVYQGPSGGEGLIWVPAISGDKYSPFLGSADKAAVVAEATTWATNKGYELIVY